MAIIVGNSTHDLLTGTTGDDIIRGGAGDDHLQGGDGADSLDGEFGDDVLDGGAGDDTLRDDFGGDDSLYGDLGNDTISVRDLTDEGTNARTLLLDGGDGDDRIRLDMHHNTVSTVEISGGIGNDVIAADGGGLVTIDAGSGADLVSLHMSGSDYGDSTTYLVTLGNGRDTLALLSSADRDWLAGADGTGDDGEDFSGRPTNSVIVSDFAAGPAGDRLDFLGFLGDQLIDPDDPEAWDPATNPFATGHLRLVQSGADVLLQIRLVDYVWDEATGQPAAIISYVTLVTLEGVVLTDLTADNLSGFDPSGGAEPWGISGSQLGDTLHGFSGDDSMSGQAGDDRLFGGAGNDTISGGDGADYLDGQFGNDTLHGGIGNDVLVELYGGNDSLYGQDGDDFLHVVDGDGNEGATSEGRSLILDGGAGNDHIRVDSTYARSAAVQIDGGDGNDLIEIDGGSAVDIDAGAGNDVVRVDAFAGYEEAGWPFPEEERIDYRITLGTGTDILSILSHNSWQWIAQIDQTDDEASFDGNAFNRIVVSDFAAGAGGDQIDLLGFLRDILRFEVDPWQVGSNPFASGHLKLVQDGANVLLQVRVPEEDWSSGTQNFSLVYKTIIVLEGVTVASLTADNLSGFSPQGTTSSPVNLSGTSGNDLLSGLSGNDQIGGGAGNDDLRGAAGNDTLNGGDGADLLDGDFGNDVLLGGVGDDVLRDNLGGNDSLYGQDGNDDLRIASIGDEEDFASSSRTLMLDGGAGNDRLRVDFHYVTTHSISMVGGDGNDVIEADGGGVIQINAGTGDDVVTVGARSGLWQPDAPVSSYFIRLGTGADTLSFIHSGNKEWRSGADLTDNDYFFSEGQFNNVTVIDFQAGNDGDRIDLIGFLRDLIYNDGSEPSDWDPATNPFGSGHLKLLELNGDTLLQIRVTEYDYVLGDFVTSYKTLVTLQGVSATTLTSFNLGGFDPSGIAPLNLISGTEGEDYLEGSSGGDQIDGLGGQDILFGDAGDDVLNGGAGNDILVEAHNGDDPVGSFGNDTFDGGEGSDRLIYYNNYWGVTVDLRLDGIAQNTGGGGIDTLIGIEHVTGTYQNDTLIGDEGDNWLFSYSGTDFLYGNEGTDLISVGIGAKTIDGGSGIDGVEVLDYAYEPLYGADGITLSLMLQGAAQDTGMGQWTLTNIEMLGGWWGNDDLSGDNGANVLLGHQGDDRLIGYGGDDVLGGDGVFLLDVDASGPISYAEDGFTGDHGADFLDGGAGNDRLVGGGGNDTLLGGTGNDVLRGGTGVDVLAGGAGADVFTGTAVELSGDTITDFGVGDTIIITDVSFPGFSFSLSGNTLTYTGGSLVLQAGIAGKVVARIGYGGGVELTIEENDVRNDFDGDGRSDVLWRHDSGTIASWLGSESGALVPNNPSVISVPNYWQIAGTGDFNGDGRDDILWRGQGGEFGNWLSAADGTYAYNEAAGIITVSSNWQVAGTGDFNGDGRDDVLWRADSGEIGFWVGGHNGSVTYNPGYLVAAADNYWQIAGIGDFNNDGKDDILWRGGNGEVGTWLGSGSSTGFVFNAAAGVAPAPLNWEIVGTGDFNGDNRDDIVWRSDIGEVGTWLANADGSFTANNAQVVMVPTEWHIADVGDFNGDNVDDILWRHDSGLFTNWLGQQNGIWLENNGNALGGLPNDWSVDAPDILIV